jgi:CheY-like chemotaxis protein
MAKKILVIDDDTLLTKTISNLLNKKGYSAAATNDGYEALDRIIGKTEYDLIICDIRMPGLNGVETVKKIREYLKNKNKPDVPVIFITGFADTEINKEAEKIGKVVFKPFDTDDFLENIEDYID